MKVVASINGVLVGKISRRNALSTSALRVVRRRAAAVFASISSASGSSSVVFIWEAIWFYGGTVSRTSLHPPCGGEPPLAEVCEFRAVKPPAEDFPIPPKRSKDQEGPEEDGEVGGVHLKLMRNEE